MDDLDTWENGCTIRSIEVRPAMVGFGLLKLSTHMLLIANADHSSDDKENTNSARFYTECSRMLAAVQHTQARLLVIESKFKENLESAHYVKHEIWQNWDENTWYGDVTLPLPNGSFIQGPSLSETGSIFNPGAIDRKREELDRAGQKLVADWKAEQLSEFYDSDYNQLKSNIDNMSTIISGKLNSRNYAYQKDAYIDNQKSTREVDGSRNSRFLDPKLPPKLVNFKVVLGEPLLNSPQGIESIAFKNGVGVETVYTITVFDKNGHVLKSKKQTVDPKITDYVINFRDEPYDTGSVPVGSYITITSNNAVRYTLDEFYCFTNNIAPATMPQQNSTVGTHVATIAIAFKRKPSSGYVDLYSGTLQEPDVISRWSTGFKEPMVVGAVVINSRKPATGVKEYYDVELLNEAGIPIGIQQVVSNSGTAERVEFYTTKYASRLRISGKKKNSSVMLTDVEIYKKGDSK